MKIKCHTCGHIGNAKVRNRGSYIALLFLLLFFVIPGIFYLIYMVTGRVVSCPKCSSKFVSKFEGEKGGAFNSIGKIVATNRENRILNIQVLLDENCSARDVDEFSKYLLNDKYKMSIMPK